MVFGHRGQHATRAGREQEFWLSAVSLVGSAEPAGLAVVESAEDPVWAEGARQVEHRAHGVERMGDLEAIGRGRSRVVRQEAKRVLGPDHPDTLTAQINLAVAYQEAGRAAEAIPLFVRSLEALERRLGPDHRDAMTTRNNLAVAYREAGRAAEAIPLLERTLAVLERRLGPEHPNAVTTRNNLAVAYQ